MTLTIHTYPWPTIEAQRLLNEHAALQAELKQASEIIQGLLPLAEVGDADLAWALKKLEEKLKEVRS